MTNFIPCINLFKFISIGDIKFELNILRIKLNKTSDISSYSFNKDSFSVMGYKISFHSSIYTRLYFAIFECARILRRFLMLFLGAFKKVYSISFINNLFFNFLIISWNPDS